MTNLNFDKIFYGGDYNPDQWDRETWEEDMRLFKKANINLVSLPIFSWAKLQPSEDTYDFSWLDDLLDLVHENGIVVSLATPTAAQPAWMSRMYPDILPVDVEGRKRTHGKRVNICPNSRSFRKFARKLAEKMAERYKNHPALAIWHVANEYGTYCFCETCEKDFRGWLKDKYQTVNKLNERWNTAFWGHTIYDWEDVVVPSERNDDNKWYQPIMIDYLRFMTDSNIACFKNEYDVLKAATPNIPITTNMSGFIKKLDQFKMTAAMDIVGWDNYPWPTHDRSLVSFKHDLMRGLKGGQPFLLVEQSPNQQNWQPYNVLKRPGEVRKLSYQAIAHGADSVLYFQLRQSIGGVEKFHGAVISHAGHEHTRVFRECAQIGDELAKLGGAFTGARSDARVGILFDWDNWWALEMSSGPSRDIDYMEQVVSYYKAFYERNIPIDVLPVNADISQYDLIIAPMLYMIKEGVAEKIESFVEKGGHFLTSVMSGLVDENDLVQLGGYPGKLRNVLGIWVEETDALLPGNKNKITINNRMGHLEGSYDCQMLCDLLHLETAEGLAVYENDFYKGMPGLTVNTFGEGKAWYVATCPEQRLLNDLAANLIEALNLEAPAEAPLGIEVTTRRKEDKEWLFFINHLSKEAIIKLDGHQYIDILNDHMVENSFVLAANDVVVMEKMDND